jgi:hypothetical protein
MEESKEPLKFTGDQHISQGVIDLKEFAPHLLDSNTNLKRSYSLNSGLPGSSGLGLNQSGGGISTSAGGSNKE